MARWWHVNGILMVLFRLASKFCSLVCDFNGSCLVYYTSSAFADANRIGVEELFGRPACIRIGFEGYYLEASSNMMQVMPSTPYKELLVTPPVSSPGVAPVRSTVRILVSTPANALVSLVHSCEYSCECSCTHSCQHSW
jgi:hypothetical protein